MSIEEQYNARIDAMSPKERVARSGAMFQWMRDTIGRALQKDRLAECGREYSAEELKLRIAFRIYSNEPAVVALIERRLANLTSAADA
jgi:hypothetical protein